MEISEVLAYEDIDGKRVRLACSSHEECMANVHTGETWDEYVAILKVFQSGELYSSREFTGPFTDSLGFFIEEALQDCIDARIPAEELSVRVYDLFDHWESAVH